MTIAAQYADVHTGADLGFKNTDVVDLVVGKVVKVDAANAISASNLAAGVGVVLTTADGDRGVGVVQEAGAVGKGVKVRTAGEARCVASGAITAGTFVMATAAGKVKAQAAGSPTVGMALTTAADGEELLVLVGLAHNA